VCVYQEVLLLVRGLDECGSADVGERERKWRVRITFNRRAPSLSPGTRTHVCPCDAEVVCCVARRACDVMSSDLI